MMMIMCVLLSGLADTVVLTESPLKRQELAKQIEELNEKEGKVVEDPSQSVCPPRSQEAKLKYMISLDLWSLSMVSLYGL